MTGLNEWNSTGEIFFCSALWVICSKPFDLGWTPGTELGLKPQNQRMSIYINIFFPLDFIMEMGVICEILMQVQMPSLGNVEVQIQGSDSVYITYFTKE